MGCLLIAKNKIILTLLVLISVSVSCNKENDTINNDISGTFISLSDVKSYLPSVYQKNNSKIIYKDDLGNELSMIITFSEEIKTAFANGKSYSHEQFSIRLHNILNPTLAVTIGGVGLYGDKNEVQKSLNFTLNPTSIEGSLIIRLDFEDGKASNLAKERYFKSVSLNDKQFDDVFGTKRFIPDDPYSELWVNSNEGVVAFKDYNNVLWVFDRIEE